MAYLTSDDGLDISASEIVDLADVSKPIIPSEIVDFGAMRPMRRKQAMPGWDRAPDYRPDWGPQTYPLANMPLAGGLGVRVTGIRGRPPLAVSPQRYAVMLVQSWINERAFRPGSGRRPIAIDGVWGRQTEWGFGLAGGEGAAGLAAAGMVTPRLRASGAQLGTAMAARRAYLTRRG